MKGVPAFPVEFEPDRLLIVVSAFGLSVLLGFFQSAVPPFWQAFNAVFGNLGRRLNRDGRPKGDLAFRGVLFTILSAGLCGTGCVLLEEALAKTVYQDFLEAFVLASLLATGGVWRMLWSLRTFRKTGGKTEDGIFLTLAQSVRCNFALSDMHAVTRASTGWGVRMADKGFVLPVFWYLVAGLPVALSFSALSAILWRFGRDGHLKNGFLALPFALERLAGAIPHILTAAFVTLSAVFTPGANPFRAFGALLSRKIVPYRQGGLALSVMAAVLNVGLGGPLLDIDGYRRSNAWAGPEKASARQDPKLLGRVVYLLCLAHVFVILLVLGASVLLLGKV